jgi:hypothetical protein
MPLLKTMMMMMTTTTLMMSSQQHHCGQLRSTTPMEEGILASS